MLSKQRLKLSGVADCALIEFCADLISALSTWGVQIKYLFLSLSIGGYIAFSTFCRGVDLHSVCSFHADKLDKALSIRQGTLNSTNMQLRMISKH